MDELEIIPDTQFSTGLDVFDATGAPKNLTGYTVEAYVVIGTSTTEATATVTNAALGKVTITMTALQTHGLEELRWGELRVYADGPGRFPIGTYTVRTGERAP